MRDLYLAYSKNEKLQTLSAEISWSHNIAILEKCKDILEREFYMRMSKKYSWSYRVILNQMSSKALPFLQGDLFGHSCRYNRNSDFSNKFQIRLI